VYVLSWGFVNLLNIGLRVILRVLESLKYGCTCYPEGFVNLLNIGVRVILRVCESLFPSKTNADTLP
jgi:hypothetical protein